MMKKLLAFLMVTLLLAASACGNGAILRESTAGHRNDVIRPFHRKTGILPAHLLQCTADSHRRHESDHGSPVRRDHGP